MTRALRPEDRAGFAGGYADESGRVHGRERKLYQEWLAGPGADLDDDNSTPSQRMAAYDQWKESRA